MNDRKKGLMKSIESERERVQIFKKAAEDKISGLVDKALDAHEDEIELMALAKIMHA